jgi:stalled ribosome alternative rescue factor ArfA
MKLAVSYSVSGVRMVSYEKGLYKGKVKDNAVEAVLKTS